MNILHYEAGFNDNSDERYERNVLGDLKHGLDLIFALKAEMVKLHPEATETLIKLLSH